MNEKIKELVEQAGTDVGGKWMSVAQAEKFAELIVTECAQVVKQTILSSSGVDPDTFTGTVTTVEEIKRHFGIAE